MEQNNKLLSQEDIMKLPDSRYEKVLDGVPCISPIVEDFEQKKKELLNL